MPLQIATLVGFVVSFIAFLGIPYVIVNRLLGFYVEGVSTLLFAILFLGGIQLITLGIIGEYISRIYDEVKRRPLYLVSERHNIDGRLERGERDPGRAPSMGVTMSTTPETTPALDSPALRRLRLARTCGRTSTSRARWAQRA